MVLLTMRDENRLKVIETVMDGRISIEEASNLLGIKERQVFRLLARVRKKGGSGIVHGNKRNQHACKWREEEKKKLLDLVKEKYGGVNDTQMREYLEDQEGIVIGRESLRKILRESGHKPKIKRRSRRYRVQRERKEAFGKMIQIDASIHDWLEGRGSRMSLVGGIDDATGYVWGLFEKSENTWGYFRLVEKIVLSEGIPLSLYSDRHTIFHSPKEPTVIEQIQNTRSLTQFGRAMKEMGIEMIKAYSPQAKGRIERLWRTFQDRLVVEMRMAGISDREQANVFLKGFLERYNKRFCKSPKTRVAVFRKRPCLYELQRTLCYKEIRTVNRDHTISFEGFKLQIPPNKRWASIAGQKVTVLQLEDKSLEVFYKGMQVLIRSAQQLQNLVKYYETKLKQLDPAA